jgi:rhodanese-related sulfurtransferase
MIYMIDDSKKIKDLVADPASVVVDVRPKSMYEQKHIPGAINVPFDTINAQTAEEKIGPKDKQTVLYCQTGVHSHIAEETLSNLGYTNLHELKGGISQWPYDTQGAVG